MVEVIDDKCAVCGRRHGNMPRLAPDCPLGHEDEEHELPNSTGQANRNRVRLGQEVSRRVYLDDCQEAIRKAIRIFSAVYGTDASQVEAVRQQLGVLQTFVADLLFGDLWR